MKIVLDGVVSQRGRWSLSAEGTIGPGIHLLTGEVGSGKTTFALMLAGLFPPFLGTVEKSGIASEMISFQFPEYQVSANTLAGEVRSWGLDPAAILSREQFGGREEADPLSLSRGELKRLHLACILSRDYDLLVLDEPFSSLDCSEKERYCRILSQRSRGITFVLTHEQSYFPRVDFIWEIRGGCVTCLGRTRDAIPHWEHAPSIVRRLLRSGRVPENLSQADLLEAACRT
jgi:energy-coupling factor transport system ATP-binding protein